MIGLSQRVLCADGIFVCASVALGLLLVAFIHSPEWTPLGVFASFVVLTEMLDTELPSGRHLSLSMAPILGFALIGSAAMNGARFGPSDVTLVALTGAAIAVVLRAVVGRSLRLRDTAASIVIAALCSITYRALYSAGPHWLRFGRLHPAPGTTSSTQGSVIGLLAVAAIAMLLPAITWVVGQLQERHSLTLRGLGSAVASGAPLQVAIVSVGALVALAYPKLGPWSFPLFLGPLAATQYAFRQFSSIRTTYVQTVRALARVPEMSGYTEPGHSRRVAELSTRIATKLGCSPEEVLEIEYGALLHDIGRVVLEDPEHTGSETPQRLELALTGASIVEKTGHFPGVSRMIREQFEPYRRRGENTNLDLALGAKIIKVASAYDDMVRPGELGHTPWDALERLHLGMAYDFDPAVIQALTRVLEERGDI